MTELTYQTMMDEAAQTLRQGHGVILDATFYKRTFRDRLRKTLGDENLKWIITEAGETTKRQQRIPRAAARGIRRLMVGEGLGTSGYR